MVFATEELFEVAMESWPEWDLFICIFYKQTNNNHRWSCYQAIALNDQQVGPTSLAPLSP